MNNHLPIYSWIVISLFLLSACSTTKKGNQVSKIKSDAEQLMDQMIRQQVNVEWFYGKAKIAYEDDNFGVRASSSIKMKKDSVLWMNVKKLGLEVGRVLITRDSIYILDRLNNEYYAKNLNYVEKEFGLPANLGMLQTIILGNPIFFVTQGLQSAERNTSFHIFGSDDKIENQFWLNKDNFELQKMAFKDLSKGIEAQFRLEGYQEAADNQNFSYIRNLELTSQETGKVSIGVDFSKVELNIPKSIRFEIPKRYTRAD